MYGGSAYRIAVWNCLSYYVLQLKRAADVAVQLGGWYGLARIECCTTQTINLPAQGTMSDDPASCCLVVC